MCYEPQFKNKTKAEKKHISVLYLAALDPQFLYFKLPSIFQRELHYRSLRQKQTECHSLGFLISECSELSCPHRCPPFRKAEVATHLFSSEVRGQLCKQPPQFRVPANHFIT